MSSNGVWVQIARHNRLVPVFKRLLIWLKIITNAKTIQNMFFALFYLVYQIWKLIKSFHRAFKLNKCILYDFFFTFTWLDLLYLYIHMHYSLSFKLSSNFSVLTEYFPSIASLHANSLQTNMPSGGNSIQTVQTHNILN